VNPVTEAFNNPHEALIRRTESGRWPKGVSGNPAGRPPKERFITKLCEEIMEEKREEIKARLIASLTERGMAGVLLFKEFAERVEGKVTQGIELSGTISTMTDEQVDERLTKLLDLDLKNLDNNPVIDVTAQPTHEPERDTIPTK
jgi:hypothetical protein